MIVKATVMSILKNWHEPFQWTGLRAPRHQADPSHPGKRILLLGGEERLHAGPPRGMDATLHLEHPDLQDMDIPNTGYPLHSPMLVTSTMVMYTSLRSDGTPAVFGVDKETGEQVGVVELEEGEEPPLSRDVSANVTGDIFATYTLKSELGTTRMTLGRELLEKRVT